MENPWNIKSINELQYFVCPACCFKDRSKQEFINHAYNFHSNCVSYLDKISDGSINDILCPWNEKIKIENENLNKYTEDIEMPYENTTEDSKIDIESHIKVEAVDNFDQTEDIIKTESSIQRKILEISSNPSSLVSMYLNKLSYKL